MTARRCGDLQPERGALLEEMFCPATATSCPDVGDFGKIIVMLGKGIKVAVASPGSEEVTSSVNGMIVVSWPDAGAG